MPKTHRSLKLRSRLSVELLENRDVPAIYRVTGLGEGPGQLIERVGFVESTTLEAAIEAASTHANEFGQRDVIDFAIPNNLRQNGVFTIALSAPLPSIRDGVIIDGSTQSSFLGEDYNSPLIALKYVPSGPAGFYVNGLSLANVDLQSPIAVKNLMVQSFTGAGVMISGAGGNTVSGMYLGVGTDGTMSIASALGGSGIVIMSSPKNLIGGLAQTENGVMSRNIITGGPKLPPNAVFEGEYDAPISTDRPSSGALLVVGSGSGENRIKGNYIGVNKSGSGLSYQNGPELAQAAIYFKGSPLGDVGASNIIGGLLNLNDPTLRAYPNNRLERIISVQLHFGTAAWRTLL